MGEVKAARDRTFKVSWRSWREKVSMKRGWVGHYRSCHSDLEIMEREGIDEEGAMVMILDLGLKDYVVELYRRGDVTIREAAAILGLNLRQTLEIVEKKIGGNVGREEAIRALELAKKLAEVK
jgi:hypothetical protein